MIYMDDFILYTSDDGLSNVKLYSKDGTVWLSLEQIAELFHKDKSTISRHIRNIFAEGELSKNSVVANYATTASDGKTYHVDFYSLDLVNSFVSLLSFHNFSK